MEAASYSSQEDQSKEDQQERNLCLVKGVVVEAVEVLPVRPVDTGVGEESHHQDRGQDDGKSSGKQARLDQRHEATTGRRGGGEGVW